MELIEAVQNGILQDVKDVISQITIPLDCQWIDYAALNNAIAFGHTVVADFLLDLGYRVNRDKETDFPLDTPLHNAVILEDVALVEKLIDKEASILSINTDGNTPLHLAFLLRNENIIDLLLDALQRTKNLLNLKNNNGLSHMHIACTRKHSTIVESYVASGVDLSDCVYENSYPWGGYSALHFAVEYRSLNAVKAILNYSVYPQLSIEDSTHSSTPLALANQHLKELTAIIQFLLSKTAENKDSIVKDRDILTNFQDDKKELKKSSTTGLTDFHMACLENNADVVECFINNGASVHQPVVSHIDLFHLYTPLHLAVENKCKKTVEVLLKHGADVNLQNNYKMTPLHLAMYVNNHAEKQDIIDYLYTAVEAKLANPKDVNGLNYLHIACTRNDLKTVTYLLDAGEDVNAQIQQNSRNVRNFTPLDFAVDCQHLKLSKLLIERGANVNRYSLEGTPLHLACKHGHANLVRLLLDNGARVDETITLHSLIKVYARTKDNLLLEQVERLVSLGVDIDAKNEFGNTALHVFCSRCDDENDSCARFLLDLGADVNLENNEGQTAFEVWSDSSVFYHHVQELKALGVEVNFKNEECCRRMKNANLIDEEILERMKHQRFDEITYMKSIKLSKHLSLDEFLRLDAEDTAMYAGNDVLKLVVTTNQLMKYFPSYTYLIKLQYCRAVGRFGLRKNKGNSVKPTEAKRRFIRICKD